MAVKIFITGVTGYIGGDILYALNQAHPDWEYSALIRSEEKAKQVQAKYPKVKPVIGGLDDSDIIKKAASQADIVIHTADASDHEGAARAIAAGLAEGHSASKPGFWLHTSGTGILTFADQLSGRLGEPDDKVFNDWAGVEELTNLPDEAFHRDIDKIVLEASSPSVRTAVVCPPTIYGEGRGPVSGRSRQAYTLAKMILTRGVTPIIGGGKARWNSVHVHDLSDAYVLLAEAAAAGNLSDELWNARGYFLAENGEFIWGDYSRLMAKKAYELGFLKEVPQEQPLSKDEAVEFGGFEAVSWGLNSRGKAERLSKTLGWKPHRPSIEEEIPTILKSEKALLEKN
ncbi:hypothetical protein PFICI_00002 [Pestalotiopsis fici W106-1]|uniref:NAD(P)-binding domain-containing protein n=1 Tax=Pestalotiopsis fici (strain W106-1 / CGMCC3.15140) TaxID=1229662 RepID=W3XJH9_PESFW|nr:uncharacterized protein PFICI_00002 [Pestalotiopsis fici W106-1]ETS86174.1 hypothetical protein PFICI_00002 [Pestalotiopsis fici W106-1]